MQYSFLLHTLNTLYYTLKKKRFIMKSKFHETSFAFFQESLSKSPHYLLALSSVFQCSFYLPGTYSLLIWVLLQQILHSQCQAWISVQSLMLATQYVLGKYLLNKQMWFFLARVRYKHSSIYMPAPQFSYHTCLNLSANLLSIQQLACEEIQCNTTSMWLDFRKYIYTPLQIHNLFHVSLQSK